MNFAEFTNILEALSYLATIVGIPVAIAAFIYEKRKDRLDNEANTYLRANDKYIQYLILCLEHPELGFSEMNEADVRESGLNIKQLTIFSILLSMLETGFLLYRNHNSAIRESQWRGWHQYMAYWVSRDDFRKAWPVTGLYFDKDFQSFMNNLISDSNENL